MEALVFRHIWKKVIKFGSCESPEPIVPSEGAPRLTVPSSSTFPLSDHNPVAKQAARGFNSDFTGRFGPKFPAFPFNSGYSKVSPCWDRERAGAGWDRKLTILLFLMTKKTRRTLAKCLYRSLCLIFVAFVCFQHLVL